MYLIHIHPSLPVPTSGKYPHHICLSTSSSLFNFTCLFNSWSPIRAAHMCLGLETPTGAKGTVVIPPKKTDFPQ